MSARGNASLNSTTGSVTLGEDAGLLANGFAVVAAGQNVTIEGDIQSFGGITISAGETLSSSGVLSTLGDITLASTGDVDVAEGLLAGQNVEILALEEARIENGFISTVGTATVEGRDVALGENALFDTGGGVSLTASEDFENAANLAGLGQNLTLNFAADLRNLVTGIFAFEQLDLNVAGGITNDGLIFAEGDGVLRAGSLTNNATGQIFAQNLILDISGNVINDGSIAAVDRLDITVAEQLFNNGAISAQTISLIADEVKNAASGVIQAEAGALTLSLLSDLENAGLIFSADDLTLSLGGNFSTSGIVAANGDATLDVNAFEALAGGELSLIHI